MEAHGFIHSMMDVKVLILFVMARVQYPVDVQQLYELCLQDERLTYFDVCEAVPELVSGGHLDQAADGTLTVTDKGRETGAVVEDSLAFPVARRAEAAAARFNLACRRAGIVHADLVERADGDYTVVMSLDDEKGRLMTLELMAPTKQQARRLAAAFEAHAESLYQTVMDAFLARTEAPRDAL